MTVKEYLVNNGLSEDDAKVIADNPAYAGVYEKAIKEAEDGKTAYMKAQETKEALEKWNQNEVVPYVQKADARVAKLEADLAARNAHMKTLKDLGYDIPEAYLEAGANPVTPPAVTPPANQKDYEDMIHKGQLAQMELISLSNRYRGLTGNELDPAAEYEDFGKNRRPNENLRGYIDRKYDLSGISQRKDDERKTAYEQKLKDDAVSAAKAEWMKSYGSNPETALPRASRFDHVIEARKEQGKDDSGRPLWQTEAGRNQARQQRLEKYSDPKFSNVKFVN